MMTADRRYDGSTALCLRNSGACTSKHVGLLRNYVSLLVRGTTHASGCLLRDHSGHRKHMRKACRLMSIRPRGHWQGPGDQKAGESAQGSALAFRSGNSTFLDHEWVAKRSLPALHFTTGTDSSSRFADSPQAVRLQMATQEGHSSLQHISVDTAGM